MRCHRFVENCFLISWSLCLITALLCVQYELDSRVGSDVIENDSTASSKLAQLNQDSTHNQQSADTENSYGSEPQMPVSKVRDLLAEAISAVVDNYLYAGRSPDPEPETDDLDFTDIYTSDAEKRDMISDKEQSFLANIHKYREHENWTDIKKLAEHPVHVPIWSLDSNERHMRRYLEPAYLIDGTLYDPTNATVANQSVYIDSRTHYNGAWHKKTSADNSTMARSDELECLMRKYTYKAVNTDGRGHKCWGLVTAVACYGRCDSSETADRLFPYRRAQHYVCVHKERIRRQIMLPFCSSAKAPQALRVYHFTDANGCACEECSTSNTSCESE